MSIWLCHCTSSKCATFIVHTETGQWSDQKRAELYHVIYILIMRMTNILKYILLCISCFLILESGCVPTIGYCLHNMAILYKLVLHTCTYSIIVACLPHVVFTMVTFNNYSAYTICTLTITHIIIWIQFTKWRIPV